MPNANAGLQDYNKFRTLVIYSSYPNLEICIVILSKGTSYPASAVSNFETIDPADP